MKEIKIKAPATTANLGPAFDCLGMALNIFDELTVKLSDSGETEPSLAYQAINALFRKAGRSTPPLSLHFISRIPQARGLGSSAAQIVCGLLGANYLLDHPLSQEELLHLGTELEGHPDNITPALFGGLQAVIKEGDKWLHFPLPIPRGLKVILFIPDFPMPTKESRLLLNHQVLREDAVYNIGRAILLTSALLSGKQELLRYGTQDRLHQPERKRLFPAMEILFDTALQAGASGVCLSGGGSSILALSFDKENQIASALKETASRLSIGGTTLITAPTKRGAYIVKGK